LIRMNEQLQQLIAKILLIDLEEISPALQRDDVEDWDSMTHLVLVSDIEHEFGVSFSDEEVVEISSVADIVALLSAKGVN